MNCGRTCLKVKNIRRGQPRPIAAFITISTSIEGAQSPCGAAMLHGFPIRIPPGDHLPQKQEAAHGESQYRNTGNRLPDQLSELVELAGSGYNGPSVRLRPKL